MIAQKQDGNKSVDFKARIRRRIAAYKGGNNWVTFYECDFKGIFETLKLAKNLPHDTPIEKVVELCTPKEAEELDGRLDCYQLNKRLGI